MNLVDRADNLRTNYSMGQGLRQRKWWWSIFLWAFDVAIINSYLLYKSYLEMHGFEPKSYYTYQEENFLGMDGWHKCTKILGIAMGVGW